MIDDRTLAALAHLVHTIRTDRALPAWDAQGVTSVLTALRHLDIDELTRRIGHLAGHPDTRSPGRLRQPWKPEDTPATTPRNPRADEACEVCGAWAHRCLCTDDQGRRTGPTRRHRTGCTANPGLMAQMRAAIRTSQTPDQEPR